MGGEAGGADPLGFDDENRPARGRFAQASVQREREGEAASLEVWSSGLRGCLSHSFHFRGGGTILPEQSRSPGEKSGALGSPDRVDSNPTSSTYQLCDLGQVIYILLGLSFLICKMECLQCPFQGL